MRQEHHLKVRTTMRDIRYPNTSWCKWVTSHGNCPYCPCTSVHAKSLKSCPILCDPMDHSQALLSMGSSRQEYWSGLPCPPLGDLPKPGLKPTPLMSALTGGFLTTSEYFRSVCFSGYLFLFPLSPAPETACLHPAATIRVNQENRSHCRSLK